MGPTTLATAARPAALPGRQLGRDASCSSSASARLARAARFAPRGRRLRVALAPRALDRDRDGGIGGDGGELNMNVLAERMKALKAKEASENAAVVDAAIERDQAIVAGIRGDAAERRTPERASVASCRPSSRQISRPRRLRPMSDARYPPTLKPRPANPLLTRPPASLRARSRRIRRAHRTPPLHAHGGHGVRERAVREPHDQGVRRAREPPHATSRRAGPRGRRDALRAPTPRRVDTHRARTTG